MKDVIVVTSQFRRLWERVDDSSQQWNSYADAMLGWELIVQRMLWDMGYDAQIEHTSYFLTDVYERVGPDKHKPASGIIRQHIEDAIATVTLDDALVD